MRREPVSRTAKTVEAFADHIDPSRVRILSANGLAIVESKREGIFVWDEDDRRLIDMRTVSRAVLA